MENAVRQIVEVVVIIVFGLPVAIILWGYTLYAVRNIIRGYRPF